MHTPSDPKLTMHLFQHRLPILLLTWLLASVATAQPPGRNRVADKPLFRDPVFDGAADPSLMFNFRDREWYMLYTNRRANLPEDQIDGVNWVHGTKIGIARSRRGDRWEYVGTAKFTGGDFGVPADQLTFWAPEITFADGAYHMFVTVVPGVFRDWNHPRAIAHYTSRDLENWQYESTLELSSQKVIDACVLRMPDGGWRLWYNNEADKKSIYYADSKDLSTWTDKGKVDLPGGNRGEGPKVFRFENAYWMVVDEWRGLAVYRSDDAQEWTRQEGNLLSKPGAGADDGAIGQHADVLALGNRAYLFYFTHPDRGPAASPDAEGFNPRRTSIQVAELKLQDGRLTCNRDEPARVNLRFARRPNIHDPSTLLKQDGRYWCFSTGRGLQALCSDDLENWRLLGPVFPEMPSWVRGVVPNQDGVYWAPDVIKQQDRYLLYYSVSSFGKQTSAIALASSPTLNPDDEAYQWTDHGIVVQTDESSDHNAIDPAIVRTPDGGMWMVYGSYWTGIKLFELDPETGKRISPDAPTYSLARNEQIEAAAIEHHEGYYYLFVNWGHCCRGVRSTYNIRVGRSREITGPYLDRNGVDLLEGGGTLLLDTDGVAIGPGHAAFFEHDGQPMLSYHFYSGEDNGRAKLGVRRLEWDEEGWPRVGDRMLYTGNIVQQPRRD